MREIVFERLRESCSKSSIFVYIIVTFHCQLTREMKPITERGWGDIEQCISKKNILLEMILAGRYAVFSTYK